MEFFYAQQLRQYRLQVMRAFSNFYVSFGNNADGSPILHRVPCRYGDSSRIAETILSANSDNKMPTTPFISVHVTGMSLAPERRAAPTFVSTKNVIEREYDAENGRYLETQGNKVSVSRYMPVPYTLEFNVDIWTSNLDQKEQLIEQTQVLFNGMIDIQTSTNPLDWTALTTLEPTNITWSSRSIPIGTENPIDVFTVAYKMPIWINPPAQVTYQKIIEQIVTNIYEGTFDPTNYEWTEQEFLTRAVTTPQEARMALTLVSENLYELQLQNRGGNNNDEQHLPTRVQGTVRNGTLIPGSSIRFNDYVLTVPNTSMDDFVAAARAILQDTHLSVLFNLHNQVEFWNHNGGDVTLANIINDQLGNWGLAATTYAGGTLAWWRLFDPYGAFKNYSEYNTAATQIRLLTSVNLDDRSHDLVGWCQQHATNQNILRWTPDISTWPSTTLANITAVINPQKTWPGNGLSLPQVGQRYLLLDEISDHSVAWGAIDNIPTTLADITAVVDPTQSWSPHNLAPPTVGTRYLIAQSIAVNDTHWPTAHGATANSIVQWDGTLWQVTFDSAATTSDQIVYNITRDKWLRWHNDAWSIISAEPNDIIEWDGGRWNTVFDAANASSPQYVINNFNSKWLVFDQGVWDTFPPATWLPGQWRISI
jgi:T4-like virus Myoviridae tail sheath stabiliser